MSLSTLFSNTLGLRPSLCDNRDNISEVQRNKHTESPCRYSPLPSDYKRHYPARHHRDCISYFVLTEREGRHVLTLIVAIEMENVFGGQFKFRQTPVTQPLTIVTH